MMLMDKKHTVKTDGVLETQNYGIVFNQKMVKILSDGLYSDKIMAILRELSANAYDSHVKNGNPTTPIEVHLPTTFQPLFYIRDFGVGLSPEEVRNIYTVYGASDKEENNDAIGCLGLGSKTPFCYHTRSCTIETWREGIHYIYSAHLNESGMPVLSKLSESPSTEPTGVKISLAVNKNDIENFKIKAEKLYTYFKTTPVIKGNRANIVPMKYVFAGQGWSLREPRGYSDNPAAVGIMGGLAYPISFQDTNLSQNLREVLGCKIDFFFDIGDLDIEASREGLSYDVRTKGNIVKKAKVALDEITQLIESKVNQSKSLWEARKNYRNLKTSLPDSFFRVLSMNSVKWQGKQLFYGWNYSVEVSHELTQVSKPIHSKKTKTRVGKIVSTDDDIIFVENDLKTGGLVRCRNYVACQPTKTIVYINIEDALVKAKVINELGILPSDIQKASSLPKPAKVVSTTPKVSGRGHSTPVMIWSKADLYKSYCWTNSQYDLNGGGLYVEVNQFNLVQNNNNLHPNLIGTIKSNLTTLGINLNDVYGIKTNILPKLAKSTGVWNELWTWLKATLTPLLTKYNVQDSVEATAKLGCIGGYVSSLGCYTLDIKELDLLRPYLLQNTDFHEFVCTLTQYQTMTKNHAKCQALADIASIIGLTLPTQTSKPKDLAAMQVKVYTKYNLLSKISQGNFSQDNAEHTAKYINAIG